MQRSGAWQRELVRLLRQELAEALSQVSLDDVECSASVTSAPGTHRAPRSTVPSKGRSDRCRRMAGDGSANHLNPWEN
jgi:hypothetical protein